ncbi:hypothetical protein [Streptomyces griseorubiginosus]|uniref:hypothetical protein n=1 Tax=Streptomyces griseorubiginosus TaxID=67304 RepID=UPI0036E0DD93
MEDRVRAQRAPGAEIAKASRLEEEDIEPFTIDEVQGLLVEAHARSLPGRWVSAKGEALGLHWDDVDLDAGYVRIGKTRPK